MKPHDIGNRFRQARMRRFMALAAPLLNRADPVRILDVGGTLDYWKSLPGLYGRSDVANTIVNLEARRVEDGNLTAMYGNACSLGFPDMTFDIVHSNSVIEHVGRWREMQAMAGEVRRLAPAYYVQTPNFWFPIEPHYKLPLAQFLPERARAFAIGKLIRKPRNLTTLEEVRRTVLLSHRQLSMLFPEAMIERERVLGLTKSLVAVKLATG